MLARALDAFPCNIAPVMSAIAAHITAAAAAAHTVNIAAIPYTVLLYAPPSTYVQVNTLSQLYAFLLEHMFTMQKCMGALILAFSRLSPLRVVPPIFLPPGDFTISMASLLSISLAPSSQSLGAIPCTPITCSATMLCTSCGGLFPCITVKVCFKCTKIAQLASPAEIEAIMIYSSVSMFVRFTYIILEAATVFRLWGSLFTSYRHYMWLL